MESTGYFGQLGLVLWKHVYITAIRRRYITTLLVVLSMTVLLSGIWFESMAPYWASPNKEQFFDMTDPMDLWDNHSRHGAGRFAFSPQSQFLKDLVDKASAKLGPWST